MKAGEFCKELGLWPVLMISVVAMRRIPYKLGESLSITLMDAGFRANYPCIIALSG